MFINYIILAYNCPMQVRRLVDRLRDRSLVHFYIHIDKKSALKPFMQEIEEGADVTYIKNREDCRWGDLSLVSAVLKCFDAIISDNRIGYAVLLSGQDYPIRSNSYIQQFLENHSQNDFLSIYSIPDIKKKSEKGGEERFYNYTFDCKNPKNLRMKAKIRPLSFNLKTIGGFVRLALHRRELLAKALRLWFVPRKYPQCLAKVFNEFWFVLRVDTVKYIVEFIGNHPEILAYYQYTHIPDETIFGAILCSDKVHLSALRPMCHLIDWGTVHDGSPKTLTEDDWEWIEEEKRKNHHLLFARKFEESCKILNDLDNNK